MYASKVSRETLESAAKQVGVVAEIEGIGHRFRVKLYPLVPDSLRTPSGRRKKGAQGNTKYQRTSVGYGRQGSRVHAVCWHGFRDYFRTVFAIEPDAVFRTSLDTWKGSADFEARFPQSGYKNIGPMIAPVAFQDACTCDYDRRSNGISETFVEPLTDQNYTRGVAA